MTTSNELLEMIELNVLASRFKNEFTRKSLLFYATDIELFYVNQWSWNQFVFITIKSSLAIYSVISLTIMAAVKGARQLRFLTNFTYLIMTIYFVMSAFRVTRRVYVIRRRKREEAKRFMFLNEARDLHTYDTGTSDNSSRTSLTLKNINNSRNKNLSINRNEMELITSKDSRGKPKHQQNKYKPKNNHKDSKGSSESANLYVPHAKVRSLFGFKTVKKRKSPPEQNIIQTRPAANEPPTNILPKNKLMDNAKRQSSPENVSVKRTSPDNFPHLNNLQRDPKLPPDAGGGRRRTSPNLQKSNNRRDDITGIMHLSNTNSNYVLNDLERYLLYLEWFFRNVVYTEALIVTVGFYGVLIHINQQLPRLTLYDIHFHMLNVVFVFIDLFMSAHPIRFLHFVWIYLYSGAYILFTYFIFSVYGVVLYQNLVDWDKPYQTLFISLIYVFIASLIFHLFIWLLYCLRIAIYLKAKVGSTVEMNQVATEEQRRSRSSK
ncbi:hypothetical protein HELRODRAFT_183403 [Helobdella robusta]|uniref:Uncharacterized protein n=1 Tax=Helobdella robusta TaxID=6412 RepID=T1FJK8_HELRO|nr:hypothetical protein HELRODRAFT_183403 [Helobdella robusta]ESO11228.1 hypothetical protein HELRODRAFT_183403 [Helobdella robusta]